LLRSVYVFTGLGGFRGGAIPMKGTLYPAGTGIVQAIHLRDAVGLVCRHNDAPARSPLLLSFDMSCVSRLPIFYRL